MVIYKEILGALSVMLFIVADIAYAAPQRVFTLRPPAFLNASKDDIESALVETENPPIFIDFDLREEFEFIEADLLPGQFPITGYYIHIKFYRGDELVAQSNVRIGEEIAELYLCQNFEVLPEYQRQGIGKEIVARTFLRAKQIADLYGMRTRWAVAYYIWGVADRRREDYAPTKWSETVLARDVSRLLESLEFTWFLKSDALRKFHDGRDRIRYWARDLEDFCTYIGQVQTGAIRKTETTFVKKTLNGDFETAIKLILSSA